MSSLMFFSLTHTHNLCSHSLHSHTHVIPDVLSYESFHTHSHTRVVTHTLTHKSSHTHSLTQVISHTSHPITHLVLPIIHTHSLTHVIPDVLSFTPLIPLIRTTSLILTHKSSLLFSHSLYSLHPSHLTHSLTHVIPDVLSLILTHSHSLHSFAHTLTHKSSHHITCAPNHRHPCTLIHTLHSYAQVPHSLTLSHMSGHITQVILCSHT